MVRTLAFLLCMLPCFAWSQTLEVKPGDLTISVTLEEIKATPFQREMLLLTIHGVYKRHITLEKLEQPALAGLNWMQLGQDHWYESTLDGKTVKNMRRRMAIFPDVTGKIEIGAFKHHLNLLDENNAWFEHTIESDPLTFSVAAAPSGTDWWFPVRQLTISDDWSNAPDQLAEGEGVLRIIRIRALGASPDMIPPMPEMKSPSALIFAHPEKRLVDLTPRGPVAIAFWRWTIQPRNGVSAVLEPIEFSYFDTLQRKNVDVSISAQRVAYLEDEPVVAQRASSLNLAQSRPFLLTGVITIAVIVGFAVLLSGRSMSKGPMLDWWERRRLLQQLRKSGRTGDLRRLRMAAYALDMRARANEERAALLAELDAHIYRAQTTSFDPNQYYQRFCRTLTA